MDTPSNMTNCAPGAKQDKKRKKEKRKIVDMHVNMAHCAPAAKKH